MEKYKYSLNYNDSIIPEIYDQTENYTEDIDLIKSLLPLGKDIKILEAFSGTGRIAIPLLRAGYRVTGLELANAMLEYAKYKLSFLDTKIISNATFVQKDVLDGDWGGNYDVVILGCNCLFELPSFEAQEACIKYAYETLKAGGNLYIDSANWTEDLNDILLKDSWIAFEGHTKAGDYGKSSCMVTSVNPSASTMEMQRTLLVKLLSGEETETKYLSTKHLTNYKEIEGWLKKYNFKILKTYGNPDGSPFTEASSRVIYWAQK